MTNASRVDTDGPPSLHDSGTPVKRPRQPDQSFNRGPILSRSTKRSLSDESTHQGTDNYANPPKRIRRESRDAQLKSLDETIGAKPHLHSGTLGLSERIPVFFPYHRSSVDTAAELLRRAKDDGGVRTVKLARGTADCASPAPSSSILGSRRGSDQDFSLIPRRRSDRMIQNGAQLLGSVNITEILQLDPRPTLVIDLGDEINFSSRTLSALFVNNALRARPHVLSRVLGTPDDPSQILDIATPPAEFKSWALTKYNEDLSQDINLSFEFAGTIWHSYIVRKRLKVISGDPNLLASSEQEIKEKPALQEYQELPHPAVLPVGLNHNNIPNNSELRPQHNGTDILRPVETLGTRFTSKISPPNQPGAPSLANGDIAIADLIAGPVSPDTEQRLFPIRNPEVFAAAAADSAPDKGFFDWTRLPITSSLPGHIQFARGVNWAATSLGPIESWSADLRGMCNLIMASPHPAAMYWGKDHVAIYNEPYILLAGQKHPTLMGSRYSDAWSEIWGALEEVFIDAHTNAQATMKDDDCLFLHRQGFLEETYFSWSLIPLIGEDGTVVGTYNPAFEKTKRKIAERRMLTLREIGEKTAAARNVSQFWIKLLEGLEYNEYDAPLVMIYSLQDDTLENDTESVTSSNLTLSKICHLEGTLGVNSGHPSAPTEIDLKTSSAGFASAFRQALLKNKPIVLRAADGTLDMKLFDDIDWRGYGDPSRVVVVAPIQPTTGESTLGFLVMATNPRRPYDEDYDLFVQLLGRQLATSVASVVLFEDEIRKGEAAAEMAAQDRIELQNQVRARTREAVESENKFTRMAELVPVGIYIGNDEGDLVYVNDAWYDITSFPRGRPVLKDWLDYILEEDRGKATNAWHALMTQGISMSTEFRFKTSWRDTAGNTSRTWVLATGYAEKDEDGNIQRIFGSVTDISPQKFAEELQTRRMQEAVEMKRQQTNFIDITSHEMRNPLGAILLSADEIVSSLTELRDTGMLSEDQINVINEDIEAAQTINLCARHQKRIVDDVLTLSKLDAAVLLVTPVDAQPLTVMRRALKIFEGELQSADITLDFRIDQSYYDLNIDWVRLDPFRLSQVLINLTTNAIKFTTTQAKRTILVHLAASEDRPSQEDRYGLTYIPTRTVDSRDVTVGPDWGTGEPIYIHFAVQDTGRGLTPTEKERLFQRFSQANPRTHVTYGGSGLGLFICRELVELQGGEIGVASESGKGSTFAFYIKARRSQAPAQGSVEEEASVFRYQGSRKHPAKGTDKANTLDAKSKAAQALNSPIDLSKLTESIGLEPSPSPPHSAKVITPGRTAAEAKDFLSATSPSSETIVTPEQLKILIVEDNVINQKVLAGQLRKAGCTVYVANHGGEALEQINSSTFHRDHAKEAPDTPGHKEISVVLMDLEMPVMDGMTCARTIREMQARGELVRHVPLIAVTANAREEQVADCFEGGIDGVVSKPFSVREILGRVGEIVRRASR